MLALRQAEKEEEKRAREKIRQKLEEDKVLNFFPCSLYIFFTLLLNPQKIYLVFFGDGKGEN